MSSPQLQSEHNYTLQKSLASGFYGGEFKILVNQDQKTFALKNINLQKFSEKERPVVLSELKNEYNLLRKGIPNVLKSFGSNYNSKQQIYQFTTEHLEMSLENLIEKEGPLSFNRFIPIFSDILSGGENE